MVMKKCFSLVIFLFVLKFSGIGQIDKGQWSIGGNLEGYKYEEYNDGNVSSSNTSLSILPSVGYFPASKFSVGLQLIYYKAFYFEYGANSRSLLFGAGPFIRYYVLSKGKTINLFLESNYSRGIFKTFVTDDNRGKYLSYSANLGLAVFFNENASIEFVPGFWYQITDNSNYSYERKGLKTSIGIKIYL